jgi:hypothetical protein
VAIKLALDYVPGFQVKAKKSRGRKPKWDALRLIKLLATFLHLRPRFKSERSTLQYMLRQPLYRELTRGVTKISRLKELLGKVRSADHPMHSMLQEEWMKAIFIESFAVKKVDG